MINLRNSAAMAAVAFALGALAAPASAASAPAASTTHVVFSAGSGTASASTILSKAAYNPDAAIVGAGETVRSGGGWCTYTSWGGTYYCGSQSWYGISGQLFQVFVIGTDNAVWTRWSNTSGVSGWASLGGVCEQAANSTKAIQATGDSRWSIAVECKSPLDDNYYDRLREPDGSWTDWQNVGRGF